MDILTEIQLKISWYVSEALIKKKEFSTALISIRLLKNDSVWNCDLDRISRPV